MSTRSIKIADIAKKTGISNATVSRALNHPEMVNAATLQLIQDTMKEMGYIPKKTPASSSSELTQKLVIVNVPQISNPFYSEVLRGISESAANHSVRILINQDPLVTEADVSSFLAFCKSLHVSGLILCSSLSDPDQYKKLGATIPLVQCCEYNSDDFSYVSVDDYIAAHSAMEHIYSQGRKKIAFVNGPLPFKYAKERQRGYLTFMDDMHLEHLSSWCINLPEISYDIAFASICQLLASSSRPDAIFASSDLIAAAALKAARQYHLHVPEDLIVVGFDNIETSVICYPSITTISQPRFQIGYTAGEILNDHMTSSVAHTQHILLNTELIIRQSSVPASIVEKPAEVPLYI